MKGIVCILFIYLFIISSCAIRGGGPMGGDKDEQAPKVRKEAPANYGINFSNEKIIITFDEFIELNNAAQEISITPALEKQPEIFLSKKSIVIDLSKTTLRQNTTYTIQFGQSIKDINEGNVLEQYQYVFSTGEYLDSMQLGGKVINALTNLPEKDVKVQLYGVENDTALIKGKPLYFSKVDEDGSFQLKNLPRRTFKVYALQDANQNYTVETGENVGFYTGEIFLDSNLILNEPLKLFQYSSTEKLQLKNAYIGLQKNALGFTRPLDSLIINNKKINVEGSKENKLNDNRDSVVIYPSPQYNQDDSFRIKAFSGSYETDTLVKVVMSAEDTITTFKVIPDASPENQNKFEYLVILKAQQPVVKYFPLKINLNYDSGKITNPLLAKLDSTATLFGVKYEFDADKKYTITFAKGAFLSRYNKASDSMAIVVTPPSRKNFGLLEVVVKPPIGRSIFELVDEKGAVVFSRPLQSEQKYLMPFLPPNNYRMRLIIDENSNGIWDGGDLNLSRQPEDILYSTETLNIKANWELVDVVFDAQEKTVSREKP